MEGGCAEHGVEGATLDPWMNQHGPTQPIVPIAEREKACQLDRQHYLFELDVSGDVRYLDERDKSEPSGGIVPKMWADVTSKGYRGLRVEIAPRRDLIEAVFSLQTVFERCDRQGSTSSLLPFMVAITFGSGAFHPPSQLTPQHASSPSEFSWLSVHSPITELLPRPGCHFGNT